MKHHGTVSPTGWTPLTETMDKKTCVRPSIISASEMTYCVGWGVKLYWLLVHSSLRWSLTVTVVRSAEVRSPVFEGAVSYNFSQRIRRTDLSCWNICGATACIWLHIVKPTFKHGQTVQDNYITATSSGDNIWSSTTTNLSNYSWTHAVTSKPVEVAQVEDYEERQAEVMLRPPSQYLKCLNAEKNSRLYVTECKLHLTYIITVLFP